MVEQGTPETPPTAAPRGLELENRRRIVALVHACPGIHLREVVRELEMPYGTAEYHLRVLEDLGLLRAVEEDNYRRYFEQDVAPRDRRVMGLMRKRPVRAVVLALLERGPASHHDLALASQLKPSTLSYHLERMERAGLIERRHEGAYTIVSLAEPDLVQRLLLAHGRSFGDDAVERFLDTWSSFEVSAPKRLPEAPATAPPASRRFADDAS